MLTFSSGVFLSHSAHVVVSGNHVKRIFSVFSAPRGVSAFISNWAVTAVLVWAKIGFMWLSNTFCTTRYAFGPILKPARS